MNHDKIQNKMNKLRKEIADKNFTKSQINKNIVLYTLAKVFFSELSITLLTMVPFIIGLSIFNFKLDITLLYLIVHFIFYITYLKKTYNRDFGEDYKEICNTITILKEMKK